MAVFLKFHEAKLRNTILASFPSAIISLNCTKKHGNYSIKMVSVITGRASSFLVFLEFSKTKQRGGGTKQKQQIINLLKVITFSKEEWAKETIIHDLYFFQLWVPMLLEHQVWMISIVANVSEYSSCIILQTCSSFFFCHQGQPDLFASDHLIQS